MEFFRKTLDPVIALAAIALLDIFLFLQLGAWTVGGGETMMTGLIAEFFMGDEIRRIPFWQLVFEPDAGYWKIYISLGMLFGAVLGAVMSGEFFVRYPRRLSEWIMITIGGLLMGIGIRLAFVCNVSHVLRADAGAEHGWLPGNQRHHCRGLGRLPHLQANPGGMT